MSLATPSFLEIERASRELPLCSRGTLTRFFWNRDTLLSRFSLALA